MFDFLTNKLKKGSSLKQPPSAQGAGTQGAVAQQVPQGQTGQGSVPQQQSSTQGGFAQGPSTQSAQQVPQKQKKGKKKNPQQSASLKALSQGSVSLADIIAPSAVEVDFKHVRVGDKYYRTFFVVDYPRQVSPNWLSTLIDYKETMNISMFVFPVESKDVLSNLRRKIAEMEATIQSDYKQGLDPDPKVQAALEDAVTLREELARGLERFYQFGLYATLVADTVEELDEKSRQLSSVLTGNMLVVKPATLQMEEAFKTTMPTGHDKLFITRNMDTSSVAMTFPFTSYEISQENGLLYGINTINNSLVIVDRFSFENANEVVFGKSGSGKSFLVKLEVLRQMMFDAEILVIDPEDEYRDLCHSLGGEYITFSKNSEVKLNPFALVAEDQSEAQLGIKILSLHGLLKAMMGEMTPTQEAMLDRAIVQAYKQKGITPDPATYKNDPPILEDLYKTFLNMEESEAKELAFRLEKYVKGGFAGLFNNQTNYDVKNQLTVFSIKQLEESLRPIAMHVILDFIWARVRTKLKKRMLVVDEAWYMMRHPDSAAFLQGMAKRARKYYLGVTTLTQDIEDFLNNDYGRAIVSNSSIQILLKQGSAEVEALAKAFNLSEGEKQFLLTAQVGEGLLFAGQNHITAQFIASQFEYNLITSKPQDVLEKEKNVDNPPNNPPEPQSPPPQQTQPQPQPRPQQTQTATGEKDEDAPHDGEGEQVSNITQMFGDEKTQSQTPPSQPNSQNSSTTNTGNVKPQPQNQNLKHSTGNAHGSNGAATQQPQSPVRQGSVDETKTTPTQPQQSSQQQNVNNTNTPQTQSHQSQQKQTKEVDVGGPSTEELYGGQNTSSSQNSNNKQQNSNNSSGQSSP